MDLPIIELEGSPRRMGEDFGASCREQIRQLYELRLQALLASCRQSGSPRASREVLLIARECLAASAAYDPVGYAEFAGIARAAGITEEQCYVLQGLTDLRDLVSFTGPPDGEACSSFIVGADRSTTGTLLVGQNWDLRTDNMPYVRLVHRKPDGAPETWSLTLTGCLTLIGINAEGIAVGNTNLQTTDVRTGVQYLTVLHRVLGATSLEE